jgi:diguanylate cyclase (GGDEF)-like protein/PAS domain S-box-containing protein
VFVREPLLLTLASPNPKQNRILAELATNEYSRLQDDLELVNLKLGEVLFNPGETVNFVYFPITGIVSLTLNTRNGASAELAMIGNEGLVGIPLVLGGATTNHRVIVQNPGAAYRVKVEVIRWELDQGGSLQHLALRHTQVLMTQMAQSVVCNRHHAIDQQLYRWLLHSLDRLTSLQIHMTQELIASFLGVRREAITEAAGKLQLAGLIQYSRGYINIINRAGLEARACECYGVVKAEYDRLFEIAPETRLRSRTRPNPETVRSRAEARWIQAPPEVAKSPWDNAQLVHELQVHQIELEMHNEALRHAYDEADALRDRYADIYDFAPVAYFTLNREGVILDLNLSGAILLGIKGSQKGRHRFAAFVSPGSLNTFNQFLEEVLPATQKTTCEVVLTGNTQRPDAIVRIEATPNEGGDECRMVVIDISAERAAQQALAVRERYLRAILDSFPFMVWLKDEQSQFIAVNAPFATKFGWPSTESLVGRNDFDIATPDLAAAFQAKDQAVLLSGERKMVEELLKFGDEQRWFEIYKSPIILADRPVGTVGFARDINLRHEMQQTLKDAEAQHRNLIEHLPLNIAIVQNSLIRYINPKCEAVTGYSLAECTNQAFLPMIFEADRARAIEMYQAYSRGEVLPADFEVRLIGKAGQVIDCRLHVSAMQWDGKRAALAVFEDISAQKAIDAELHRLASIDPLTALASPAHFIEQMTRALSRLRRDENRQVAVLVLDLDHFAAINKALGQLAGDAILRLFSALLCEQLRNLDFAGRIGGEKFAILLEETDLPAAAIFAERLRLKTETTSVSIGEQRVSITVSIGIAAMNDADDTVDQVMQRAELALLRAKSGGRNSIQTADSRQQTADSRQQTADSQNIIPTSKENNK